MLYIDPDQCIDCDAFRPECPVSAIYPDGEVPDERQDFIALNAEMAAKCRRYGEKPAPIKNASGRDHYAAAEQRASESTIATNRPAR